MTTNKHGESRNHRVESTQGQYSSHEFSVCERYCENVTHGERSKVW